MPRRAKKVVWKTTPKERSPKGIFESRNEVEKTRPKSSLIFVFWSNILDKSNKIKEKNLWNWDVHYTANMCREITVKVHLKNCNFEKLQFFTVDHSSLCFLPVKNCNFSIIFNVVYFALNWMLILQVFTVFKNTTKKL